jgi:hypothetical protein
MAKTQWKKYKPGKRIKVYIGKRLFYAIVGNDGVPRKLSPYDECSRRDQATPHTASD